jgi:hypothetical protein
MASTILTKRQAAVRDASVPIGGVVFDRLMAGLALLLISGVYLDGWAHNHGLVDKTFFTPWHAVLYSAYLLNALVLVSVLCVNHARGRSWLEALPGGYKLSLAGAVLFLIAGAGDMVWHILFGIEEGIDPLLSPTHLLLALGGMLIMTGPLRASWERSTRQQGWSMLWPAMLILGAILGLFSFFTSFAHPVVETDLITKFPYTEQKGSWGAASILLQSAIITGVILFALRRWRLPLGALTLILTLNTALISVFEDQYSLILTTVLAGVILDLLYWRLQPSVKRLEALRIFAFAFPLIYNLCFFVPVILYNGGIPWTIHLWLGVSCMSGVAGLLLSYLLAPPRIPVEQ